MFGTSVIQQTEPVAGSAGNYIGVGVAEGQPVDDILFALLVGVLFLFALFYRRYFRLFPAMFQSLRSAKERQPLFLPASGNEGLFRNFLIFQTLFLFAVGIFCIIRLESGAAISRTALSAFRVLAATFGILLLFYQAKQFSYFLLATIFVSRQTYKHWKESYNAAVGLTGVFLYFPVLWLLYVNAYQRVAIGLFIILFILSRLVIIYKLIRIFYKKSDNLLYLILYLCAQEILPLVFLYEGMMCLYNFIERSTLWH